MLQLASLKLQVEAKRRALKAALASLRKARAKTTLTELVCTVWPCLDDAGSFGQLSPVWEQCLDANIDSSAVQQSSAESAR